MKKQTCKCHPNSPFLWASNPRDSMFMQDHTFRAKGVDGTKTTATIASEAVEKQRRAGKMPGSIPNIGTFSKAKEDALLAYKQFGLYTRAKPNVKPSPNKHEL